MNKQNLYGILALLFIISGAAGLMYQVVWFKYLSLFLGNTTYAQTVVLATFMGGLAIGATFWGRRADVSRRPLFIYALLEIVIGIYCFLYPQILTGLKNLFTGIVLGAGWQSDSTEVLALKLLLSLCTLLLPTILMGGTLPVLVRFISERIEDSGKNVAILYFLNSFGAVIGSLLSGFFFVPLVGLTATIYAAAAVNVSIGLAAVWLNRIVAKTTTTSAPAVEPSENKERPVVSFSPLQVRFAIIVAGLSGLASMIYEVAWVRLMIPVLGSSTYSYTLMLVAFISGITIGSWLVSNLFGRLKNLFGFLALCQLGVGLSLAVTLPLYGKIPYFFWHLASILTRSDTAYPIYLILQFSLGFLIMVVPTIFLGMTLPVASRIAARSIDVLGKSVGNVFSINTLGTVIGSIAAGLILIPSVGVRHAIEIGMVLNVALGVGIALTNEGVKLLRKLVPVATGLLVLAAYFLLSTDWNRSVFLSGVFRQIAKNAQPPGKYAEFRQRMDAVKTFYYKEGTTATVAVTEAQITTGMQRVLFVNGKADASSELDLPTQVLLGQIPMLLHRGADTALVVGLGSGVTVGSILTHPIKQVQCVEISPEVIEASKLFDDVNNRALDDQRTRVVVDDALSFLKLSSTRYDVIVSEPSNPWIAGIGNLYTTEYLQECKRRLKEGGIMAQWVQLYESNDEIFQLILRTFRSAFPHILVWQSLAGDVILIGSSTPLSADYEALKGKLAIPPIQTDLARISIADLATFLSLHMMSSERVAEYADYGALNTEDLPLLEYWAPRALFLNTGVAKVHRFDERSVFGSTSSFLTKYVQEHGLQDDERLHIAEYHAEALRGNRALSYGMLIDYLDRHPTDVEVLTKLAKLTGRMDRKEESLRYLRRLVELTPNDPEVLSTYAAAKFYSDREVATNVTTFDAGEPEALLKRSIELAKDTVQSFRINLGNLYYNTGKYDLAVEQYQKVLLIQNEYGADPKIQWDVFFARFARSMHRLGKSDRAIGYALQATMINPGNEDARELIYSLWNKGSQSQSGSSNTH